MNEEEFTEAQQRFTKWLEQLRVAVMESVGGVMLRGARAVPVGSTASGTARASTSPCALVGFAFRNLNGGGTPATVIIRDGRDANGDTLVPIKLSSSETLQMWFGPDGINVTQGLFVDVADGAVDGCVFLRGPQA